MMDTLRGDIAVLGLGKSGMAVARYVLAAAQAGDPVTVTVFDSSDAPEIVARAEELRAAGAHVSLKTASIERPFDLAICSPGIPLTAPLLASAIRLATTVESEIEFAFERSRSPWVAVTGTNGKTTVTSLIDHALMSAGRPTECVGNIGDPAIDVVDQSGPSTTLVAEVSSFQLAFTRRFHPRVAVLLNITPDHIDWHGSLEQYASDKARVFENLDRDDSAVVDIDDEGAARYVDDLEDQGVRVWRVSRTHVPIGGAGVKDGWLVLDTPSGQQALLRIDDLKIRGSHNVSNALAAAAALSSLGVGARAIASGLASFDPIEHRLEPVETVCGVEYFNDSKATNPGAVRMALTAFPDRSVIVMLGGRNKGSDFDELARDVKTRCREAVVFGEAAPEIERALTRAGVAHVVVSTMAEAFAICRRDAVPGDVVLFSPACASFDEFSGYADRGRAFKALVDAASQEVC